MFQRLYLPHVRLLDAGAGIGSLSAAFVANICRQQKRPDFLEIAAYEIDPILSGYLRKTLQLCDTECKANGIHFKYEIYEADFIEEAVSLLQPNLFNNSGITAFTHTILNPPYFKINAHSRTRNSLRSIGVETSNIYPGFMAVAAKMLTVGGEFVAITPRSFCNGSYFRNFRKMFLEMMALQQVHLFDSRQKAFRDDSVLQETVIIHALKEREKSLSVVINTTTGTDDELIMSNTLPYSEIVHPDDSEQFIRIVPDALSEKVISQLANFTCSLENLGLKVSTGRVVDFRTKEYLRQQPEDGTVPLIYPVNFTDGYINHPKATRKPQALIHVEKTTVLLVPNNHYVLTKRFSSKEEKRRVVAAVYDAERFNVDWVGFENHLNYFHHNGKGLDITLARGLTVYLNCSLVDAFFRLFNGHTQVNATDLRSLKYPTIEQLLSLGMQIGEKFPSQQQIDEIVEEKLLSMTDQSNGNPTVIKSQERAMSRIPVVIEGEIKTLSPGGQNVLIEKIINEFAPRFTPGGKLLYVGDTDQKFAHFNHQQLTELGINVDSHGKMPDVIIHFTQNNWLVLIEAVTSHGPIDPKRKNELEVLFNGSQIPLVMVTTFLSRQAMVEYLPDIAWETDVWVSEAPTHLIHFNGQHLLQLYQSS